VNVLAFILGIWIVAFIFWAGWHGHALWHRRAAPSVPEAVCGCRHHYSFHDPETSRCKELDSKRRVVENGVVTAELPACRCRRYTGPEPFPSYFPQELT
jgi:hypothetical protein